MAEPTKTKLLNGDQPLESLKEALPLTGSLEASAASSSPSTARAPSSKINPLLDQFRTFAKFGDPKADGKSISLSQSDKWMKQAKVIDGKRITATDTGIYFKKHKAQKLSFPDYKKFLEELSKAKKVELEEVLEKMTSCGPPGISGTTSTVKTAAVDRLTDSGKYTGSHKLRFDSAGRGRGVEGRTDVPDATGYVSGYINKDTYDKSH